MSTILISVPAAASTASPAPDPRPNPEELPMRRVARVARLSILPARWCCSPPAAGEIARAGGGCRACGRRWGGQPLHHARAGPDPAAAGRLHSADRHQGQYGVPQGRTDGTPLGRRRALDRRRTDDRRYRQPARRGQCRPYAGRRLAGAGRCDSGAPARRRRPVVRAVAARPHPLCRQGPAARQFTYEDLADPKWKGKVCIRASTRTTPA